MYAGPEWDAAFIKKSRFKTISVVHRKGKSGLKHFCNYVMWWDWQGAPILWRRAFLL